MESHTANYLKFVESETGQSLSAIAREAGISSTTLTRPANNPDYKFSIKQSTLEAVERVTGISFNNFIKNTNATRVKTNNASLLQEIQWIPIYNVSASAGHGSFIDNEFQVDSMAFSKFYLKKLTTSGIDNLSIISVAGESMEPTLFAGDIVLVNLGEKNVNQDGLFVLRFDDALHVKRIGRATKPYYVMIISDNRSHYPTIERSVENIQIIGKVLWYGRKI